jgi:hypothetical protein
MAFDDVDLGVAGLVQSQARDREGRYPSGKQKKGAALAGGISVGKFIGLLTRGAVLCPLINVLQKGVAVSRCRLIPNPSSVVSREFT